MKKAYYLLFALPYLLLILGIAGNEAVIYANGGHMPVLMPGGACHMLKPQDVVHSCMTPASHLKVLGDWIVSSDGISSIGDELQELANDLRIPSLIAFAVLVIKDIFKK